MVVLERKVQKQNILVVGNGFDLYHYLPTRYIDFIKVVNRLMELDREQKLQNCLYVNYILGVRSPLFQEEYIEKCYEIHSDSMKSVALNLERLKRLVEISKQNVWINYFNFL